MAKVLHHLGLKVIALPELAKELVNLLIARIRKHQLAQLPELPQRDPVVNVLQLIENGPAEAPRRASEPGSSIKNWQS